MADILLYEPKADWLTLTTFDMEVGRAWHSLAHLGKQTKRMQYSGYTVTHDNGTLFYGETLQKKGGRGDYVHACMLQASGPLGDVMLHMWSDEIVQGRVKCTRIDVQATMNQPELWSQLDYMAEREKAGKRPEIKRDTHKIADGRELETITVYSGTRTSGRYTRVYQKLGAAGEYFLRFEVEFGRGYAHKIALGLADGSALPSDCLVGELARAKHTELKGAFGWLGAGLFAPKQDKRIANDDKASWLINTVLPTFHKYICQHDSDPLVADMFMQAIESSWKQGER